MGKRRRGVSFFDAGWIGTDTDAVEIQEDSSDPSTSDVDLKNYTTVRHQVPGVAASAGAETPTPERADSHGDTLTITREQQLAEQHLLDDSDGFVEYGNGRPARELLRKKPRHWMGQRRSPSSLASLSTPFPPLRPNPVIIPPKLATASENFYQNLGSNCVLVEELLKTLERRDKMIMIQRKTIDNLRSCRYFYG